MSWTRLQIPTTKSMVSWIACLCFGILCWGAGSAAAETALNILDAPVPYVADFTVSSAKGTYNGQVWHQPGLEKREFSTRNGRQAVILRRDQNAAYLINPDKRWYVALGFDAVLAIGGDLHTMNVQRSVIGEDRMAGQKVRREKLTATNSNGQRFDGEGWFTADGICLRLVGTMTEKGKTGSMVETSLSNLRRTHPDTSHFDLPKGWFGLDLKSIPTDKIVPALEKMRPMLEGR